MLYTFDNDNTLYQCPEFFRKVFSETLTEVVSREKGERGLEQLQWCRKNCGGRGELALELLGIPIAHWHELVDQASREHIDLIEPSPELVTELRKLRGHKVIYTGAPLSHAMRVTQRLGFPPGFFEFMFHWEPGDHTPVKWAGTAAPFRAIARYFRVEPMYTVAYGDNWPYDLAPAARLEMRTVLVGGSIPEGAKPNEHHQDLLTAVRRQNKSR